MKRTLIHRNSAKFLLGIILLAVALFGHLLYSVSTDQFEVDVNRYSGITVGGGPPDYLLVMKERMSLSVQYPKEIRENESPVIKLILSQHQQTKELTIEEAPYGFLEPKIYQNVPALNSDVSAKLVSAGFAIQPSETIIKSKGSRLPVEFVWSIKPSTEGKHKVFFELSDTLKATAFDTRYSYSVNGGEVMFPPSGTILLSIVVTTVWGVSGVTVLLVKGAIGLLAFILMYPVLVGYLKSRLSIQGE